MDIYIRNALVQYGSSNALNVDGLHFKPEHVYSIMGMNGSGKSTLLNCIAGIEKYHGEILYNNSNSIGSVRNRLSVMLQKPYMFNSSVYENIACGLKFRKESKNNIDEKILEFEKYFDFKNMLDKNAKNLSGGEAAKTALLRCAVLETEVTLLDEPTASMDIESTLNAELLIRKMTENGRTVILVTHDLYQAKRISDYVLIMDKGTVIENGKRARVFNAPRHPLAKAILNVSGESAKKI